MKNENHSISFIYIHYTIERGRRKTFRIRRNDSEEGERKIEEMIRRA